MEAIVRRLDNFQRSHQLTAFLWAVQKKFSDDRGGYLCALISYYGFLSVFPLLLAAFTVAAYVLAGDTTTIRSLASHLDSYPVIGPAVVDLEGKHLSGSPLALAVGLIGLVLGAQGLAQASMYASAEAWDVPQAKRPGFATRLRRGTWWYVTFGLGMVASTFVSSIGGLFHWSGGPTLSSLIAVVFDASIFVTLFRIVTPAEVPLRSVAPGAAAAGVAWGVLTGVGVGLVPLLAHADPLYGTFAPVLGGLAFIYLMARISILCIEANVVWDKHLWPRSLDGKNPTKADVLAKELRATAGKPAAEVQGG